MTKQSKKMAVRPPLNGTVVPRAKSNVVQYKNVGARAVVDPVCNDVSSSRAPATISTSAGGTAGGRFACGSQKLSGVNTAGAAIQLQAAHLPWLTSASSNFSMYRISKASLIIVGVSGTTSQGSISIMSSPDFVDTDLAAPTVGDLIVGGSQVSLSSLSNANKKIPLRIDSSWKKVSIQTSYLSGTTIVNNASVDDLIFTGFAYSVVGGPASTNVVQFYVEYDVEFKGVISGFQNA
jgi:hypothetical protein